MFAFTNQSARKVIYLMNKNFQINIQLFTAKRRKQYALMTINKFTRRACGNRLIMNKWKQKHFEMDIL